MKKEQLERICFNCNYFFPSRAEATEFGICLEDKDFEPYIDELLENMNFSCCQELIREKEFPGDKYACNQFEEVEIIEMDDEGYQTDTETGSDSLNEEDIGMDLTADQWWDHYW